MNAADWISTLYPVLSSAAQQLFNLTDTGWWGEWGGWLDLALRAGSFAYLAIRYNSALNKMEESEAERAGLEELDDQMGEWGWRICDEIHDGKTLAGKKYVKDVTAQVYDIETEENKTIGYNETQDSGKSVRSVNVGHIVKRKISRRFDVTAPDPTQPLASHTFEIIGAKDVDIDLSGAQNETWN